jgi:hypothetical protein
MVGLQLIAETHWFDGHVARVWSAFRSNSPENLAAVHHSPFNPEIRDAHRHDR